MRIGIIGPIGSGKSTLSKLLAEHYEVPMVAEPVEKNEFLPLFYEDKKTFALLSQNAFYSSLFLLMWNSRHYKACIFDSTLFSNLVFTELLRLEGIMSAYEVALTYAIADEHLKRLPDVDIHLVLVREEDQLFENVRKRGRDMEKDQSIASCFREYLLKNISQLKMQKKSQRFYRNLTHVYGKKSSSSTNGISNKVFSLVHRRLMAALITLKVQLTTS